MLLSCKMPDYTQELYDAYNDAYDFLERKNLCEQQGEAYCNGDVSYCVYNYETLKEKCASGCDDSTGKCKTKVSDSDDDSSDSCTAIGENTWSSKASSTMYWDDAVDYCDNLNECGYSDWHLPTISELRALITSCDDTKINGGSCNVAENCRSYDDCRNDACNGCDCDSSGGYSMFGDTEVFWSSSARLVITDNAWGVGFSCGNVSDYNKSSNLNVRCIR